MSELKMTLNQMKQETRKAFEDGYDNPEDMRGCTNEAGQEFVCCGSDCDQCSGNNECFNDCSCETSENTCTFAACPNDHLESCIYEKRWEMSEHTAPQSITDELGTTTQYIKVIRITKHYRTNENPQ